jgi:hypothetical protein
MPGWNPSSGVATLEQTYKLGEVDTRKRIAAWLDGLQQRELADRVRSAEYANDPVPKEPA